MGVGMCVSVGVGVGGVVVWLGVSVSVIVAPGSSGLPRVRVVQPHRVVVVVVGQVGVPRAAQGVVGGVGGGGVVSMAAAETRRGDVGTAGLTLGSTRPHVTSYHHTLLHKLTCSSRSFVTHLLHMVNSHSQLVITEAIIQLQPQAILGTSCFI